MHNCQISHAAVVVVVATVVAVAVVVLVLLLQQLLFWLMLFLLSTNTKIMNDAKMFFLPRIQLLCVLIF